MKSEEAAIVTCEVMTLALLTWSEGGSEDQINSSINQQHAEDTLGVTLRPRHQGPLLTAAVYPFMNK